MPGKRRFEPNLRQLDVSRLTRTLRSSCGKEGAGTDRKTSACFCASSATTFGGPATAFARDNSAPKLTFRCSASGAAGRRRRCRRTKEGRKEYLDRELGLKWPE